MKLGAYELLELIGRGAMGEVYRARREGEDRPLAVKRMSAELTANPVLRKRFEQECAAAVRLRHPHVIEGVDFGLDDGRMYLVMEYVDGESLAERVTRLGPMSPADVLRLAGEIGSALQAAHDASLVHRDVKPENVMVDRRSGVAKLADLGLVKNLEAEEILTRSGAWVGTVAYMAPEQFGDARHVDGRCDVYGLAATVYFALVGSSPFPQKGALTILGKKLANDFLLPSQHGKAVSEAFDAAVCRALDAEPEKRPVSCAEFVRLLRGDAATAPVPAAAATLAPAPPATPATPATPAQTAPQLQPEPDEPERRRARRFPVSVVAACAPIGGGAKKWEAEVKDVSLTGVRLRVPRRFEPSSVLSLEVEDPKSGDLGTHVARVRWVKLVQPGSWEIGCDFGRPLVECDLHIFFQHTPTTVHVEPKTDTDAPEPPT